MQSELFDCPICFLKYNRNKHIPKIISTCGHTLCSICLGSILATQNQATCPLDRIPFDINLKTIEAFATNLLILQLLDEKPDLEFKLCETHKEPVNLICLTDKCAVCKYCVEYGSHKGHEVRHINDIKKEAIKKKQELEIQLKSFDSEFQPVYSLVRTQREKSKSLIKEKLSQLAKLLTEKEAELKTQVDQFFSDNKIKIDDKLEENFALKQQLMTKIAILDDMEFNEEFVDALIGNPFEDIGVKSECENITGKINEFSSKLESSLENVENIIKTTIDNFKPVPPREKITNFTAKNSPNIFFYQNQIPGAPTSIFLTDIHEKWVGDYNTIASHCTSVSQWIFPNFYKSQVNPHANKLQEHEAEVFRTDREISEKFVKSYSIFLDYFGLKILNLKTGELTKNQNWQKRYQETFLSINGDFITIRRILTSLNNTGFRKYAIELVNFLEKEIYGDVGEFKKFLEQASQNINKSAFKNAPLRSIAQDINTFKVLSIYGDHHNNPQQIKELEENCFCKYPDGFKDSILLQ